MSVKALQEYTRFSKYAKYLPEKKRRENWSELVERVMGMHRKKFADKLDLILEEIHLAEELLFKKAILGSQRALQFGGEPILKKQVRLFNCSASHCDRPRFFQECMYVLLCGCGAGFSVQKEHINKMPAIRKPTGEKDFFIIPDSIEGWSDAVGVLMSTYFVKDQPFPEWNNKQVEFLYDLIRPEGAPISHGGKAPGPNGLRASLDKMRTILDRACLKEENHLRSIDAYDMVMHISDSVLSGGIRRSACISIFSIDDLDMLNAKTGSWFIENPQRGRSNNSVMLIRGETTREQFNEIFKKVKEFGEPGFFWSNNKDVICNPCGEIQIYPLNKKGQSGWGFCNLTEINMKKIHTKEEFLRACEGAAILGTLQAAYSDFPYLGPVTKEIVETEALLGVSMTGMMDNPDIAFDPEIQKAGALKILETNEKLAQKIGINPAARATTVKPSGNASCMLGTSSGIHPHHAKRYFRHVQANKFEPAFKFFQKYNPSAIEESVWSNNKTDAIIKFLCEVPTGSITKNQVDAIALLEKVKLTQANWVTYGSKPERGLFPNLCHNVSNTINVLPEEWKKVEKYIYDNKEWFAGISLLPMSGDKDYAQAPFTAIYTPTEIIKEYGDASILASGLVVDGLRCFDEDLWKACDSVLGIGLIPLEVYQTDEYKKYLINNQFKYKSPRDGIIDIPEQKFLDQKDWIRRAIQFANRYFNKDIKKMTYCLKDVRNWKIWLDLQREYKEVPWDQFIEEQDNTKTEQTVACSGGSCEILKL